jgi:hypothetical protein
MHLRITAILLACLAFAQVDAQKVYTTKNATVRFIAVDDKDIDATNTKATSRLEANGKLSFIMLMKDFSFEMDMWSQINSLVVFSMVKSAIFKLSILPKTAATQSL